MNDEKEKIIEDISNFANRLNNKLKLLNLIERAKVEFDNQNWSECSTLLNDALVLDNTNSTIYRGLGCICQAEKKYEQALEYFHKAIEYSNKKEVEYTLIGLIYYIQNDFDISIKYFDKAIECNDNYNEAYEYRNQAMLERQVNIIDFQESLKKYF